MTSTNCKYILDPKVKLAVLDEFDQSPASSIGKDIWSSSDLWPLQDYPSIYQLNQILAQENIIPIFAVDTSRVDEYRVRSHVHTSSVLSSLLIIGVQCLVSVLGIMNIQHINC